MDFPEPVYREPVRNSISVWRDARRPEIRKSVARANGEAAAVCSCCLARNCRGAGRETIRRVQWNRRRPGNRATRTYPPTDSYALVAMLYGLKLSARLAHDALAVEGEPDRKLVPVPVPKRIVLELPLSTLQELVLVPVRICHFREFCNRRFVVERRLADGRQGKKSEVRDQRSGFQVSGPENVQGIMEEHEAREVAASRVPHLVSRIAILLSEAIVWWPPPGGAEPLTATRLMAGRTLPAFQPDEASLFRLRAVSYSLWWTFPAIILPSIILPNSLGADCR